MKQLYNSVIVNDFASVMGYKWYVICRPWESEDLVSIVAWLSIIPPHSDISMHSYKIRDVCV